jgi:hypothetical protein
VTVIDDDDILENQVREDGGEAGVFEDPFEKWYLINQNKTMPQIWEFIMNAFTIYSLFATPFM